MVDANPVARDAAAPLHDAFISYSRRDKEFARRLGVALRAYKPPKGLGLEVRHLDIFRDEEDFTGVEYHDAVRRHLRASNRLLLICSPNARKSEYVNDEIRQFVALRGADSIVPVLCGGLANNEARDDQEEQKAFPEALCAALQMPLAVDYRAFDPAGKQKVNKDAFHGAWCSLLANLYGLSRSEVEQREKKRETQRRRITQSIVGGIMATLIAATAISVTFWRQAVEQRRAAVARQLTAQAELARNESPRLIERSVLLAVESLKRLPTLEAETVLRPQLAKMLLPVRRISMGELSGPCVFSPDRTRVAAATKEGVKVYDLLTGKRIAVLDPLPPLMRFKFSPDGQHFVTGSGSMDPRVAQNYVAQVWRLQDAKEIKRLTHTEPVFMLVFDADGRHLAVSDERFARVWEVGSEHPPQEFEVDGFILDMALSPDGGRLFTQTNRETNQVWDVASAQVLKDVPLKDGQEHIALSPDWQHVATASDDSIRITELGSDVEVRHILEPNMTKPAFTEDGQWLMASRKVERDPQLTEAELAASQSMIVWDAHKGYEWFRVRGVGSRDRLVISPDGKYVATLGAANVVQIWSDTDREVSRLDGSGVAAIGYAADGTFVTADWAGSVQLWETTQGREAGRLPHGDGIRSIAYTPDGKRLLTNSSDRVVRVWDPETSRVVAHVKTEDDAHVALDPDGKHFVVFIHDAMSVFDLEAKEITTSKMPSGTSGSVFSRDGTYLATAGLDNNVRLWAMPAPREIAHWSLGDGIASLAFSPDSKVLVASTINSDTAVVWDVSTKNELVPPFKKEGGYRQITFSPDGRYAAASVSERYSGASPIPVAAGAVVIWDTSTWKEVRPPLQHASGILAFSSDSKLLATSEDKLQVTSETEYSQEFNASIWNVATGKQIKLLRHPAPVTAGAFTADGARLVTASSDGARLWELSTGREMFLQRDSPIHAIAVSPDGKYLATADEQDVVQTWFLRPADLIDEACRRLTRDLTKDEWQQFVADGPYAPTCPPATSRSP